MARDKAYRRAEKKIEEALNSGATELNLSSMKLTELPESIGQLMHLTKLNLSDNQLTTLPESLGQLTQLHSLWLSNNQLTALPNSISEFRLLSSQSKDFRKGQSQRTGKIVLLGKHVFSGSDDLFDAVVKFVCTRQFFQVFPISFNQVEFRTIRR